MQYLFILVAFVAVWSGLMMITRKEPVHSALCLVLTFCSLAMLYFMLGAPFIGVLQVIVYAGAIMVLFVFVIMLLAAERRESEEADPLPGIKPMGLLMSAAFFGIMAWTVFHSPMNGTPGKLTFERMVSNNTQEIGMTLFGAYLLPFEITSVLLLSAMVGAIVLAKRRLD